MNAANYIGLKLTDMLSQYIEAALQEAQFETMEDGRIYARIPPSEGLWADGHSLNEALEHLRSVLSDWILVKARHGDPFPLDWTLVKRILQDAGADPKTWQELG